MKDPQDKVTADLGLKLTGAERQAAYAKRQKAAGRSQVNFWLTEAEKKAVQAYLVAIRADSSHGVNVAS